MWESLHKIPRAWGLKGFQFGEHIHIYQKRDGPLLHRDRIHPDLNLCISSSLCSSVPFITFFTKLANISLPWVLEVALASTSILKKQLSELLIYSQVIQKLRVIWGSTAWNWHVKPVAVSWDWALKLWDLTVHSERHIVSESR